MNLYLRSERSASICSTSAGDFCPNSLSRCASRKAVSAVSVCDCSVFNNSV